MLYGRMEDISFRSALAVAGAIGVAVVAGAVMLVVVLTAHNDPVTAKTDSAPRHSASSSAPVSPLPAPTPSSSSSPSPSPSPDPQASYVPPPAYSPPPAHTGRPSTPPPNPTSGFPTSRANPSGWPTGPHYTATP